MTGVQTCALPICAMRWYKLVARQLNLPLRASRNRLRARLHAVSQSLPAACCRRVWYTVNAAPLAAGLVQVVRPRPARSLLTSQSWSFCTQFSHPGNIGAVTEVNFGAVRSVLGNAVVDDGVAHFSSTQLDDPRLRRSVSKGLSLESTILEWTLCRCTRRNTWRSARREA